MKDLTCIILILILFTTCKKEINHNVESYEKIVLYSETFDADPNWKLLPENEVYKPDTSCIKVKDGQLKMLFDQPLNNCGCAWVGVEYNNENVYIDSLLNKIGVRLTLKEGYFQSLSRSFDSINGAAANISSSTFKLRFNSIDIRLPQTSTRFHRDSIIDFDTKDKLIGKEFEMIHDNGKERFLIDGVEQPLEKVWLNWQNKWNKPLSIEFNLGHLPELSPRLDKLFIDEIEIYTWKGEHK